MDDVEKIAKPLFWRKASDHPQDWQGDLIAFGLGGRYSIRTDDYGVHVWWPEDEFTFTTYPDMKAAKAAAERHWQTEFAKRLAIRTHLLGEKQ